MTNHDSDIFKIRFLFCTFLNKHSVSHLIQETNKKKNAVISGNIRKLCKKNIYTVISSNIKKICKKYAVISGNIRKLCKKIRQHKKAMQGGVAWALS